MIRRSLTELHARALDELWVNPTITVYRFVDGIEYRYPGYPYEPWRRAFAIHDLRSKLDKLGVALIQIVPKAEQFVDSLRLALVGQP